VPLRGKRCEPAYIVHTAQCMAELRGISLLELSFATLSNTERRFSKNFAPGARPAAAG
jgi:TatD DNase family protein